MTAMSVSASTPFTVHDLEGMPDDGRRYEVIDGRLLVSPAPDLPHQEVVWQLSLLLRTACPNEFHVVSSPFAVQPNRYTEVQPDVLVARFKDLTRRNLPAAPVLAAEVLSHSGRLTDRTLKRAAYQEMGTASYWIIDPDVPELEVLELDGTGTYREVARVSGDDAFRARHPFPVDVVPAALLGRLRRT